MSGVTLTSLARTTLKDAKALRESSMWDRQEAALDLVEGMAELLEQLATRVDAITPYADEDGES